jgi:hypothetical protein
MDETPNNDKSSLVKAAVTEENGEISCSVEETNRIRALLGLKPLAVKSKDQQSVDNFKEKQLAEQKYQPYFCAYLNVIIIYDN